MKMSFCLVCALVSLITYLVQWVCNLVQWRLCWKASRKVWREWDSKRTGYLQVCCSLRFAAMHRIWFLFWWDLSVHCPAGNNSSRNVLHSMQHKGVHVYMFTTWNAVGARQKFMTEIHPLISAILCYFLLIWNLQRNNEASLSLSLRMSLIAVRCCLRNFEKKHWTFWYWRCVLHDCRELRAQSNDSLLDWTCISHEDAAGADYIQGWFRNFHLGIHHTQIITTPQ